MSSDNKSNQTRLMIPNEQWKFLCAKYEFSQAEAGSRAMLCSYLEECMTRALKTSVLEADQDGKVTLKGSHARSSVSNTPGIPKGSY